MPETVRILKGSFGTRELSDAESRDLLEIVSDLSYALEILDEYDNQTLKISDITPGETYRLSYEEATEQIRIFK